GRRRSEGETGPMNSRDQHVALLAALDADDLLERASVFAAHVLDLLRRGRWRPADEQLLIDACAVAAGRGLNPVAFRAAAWELARARANGGKRPCTDAISGPTGPGLSTNHDPASGGPANGN